MRVFVREIVPLYQITFIFVPATNMRVLVREIVPLYSTRSRLFLWLLSCEPTLVRWYTEQYASVFIFS